MLNFLLSLILFCLTISSIPLLIISYFVLQISNKIWLSTLTIFYPDVEFLKIKTVRTLLDTHRNQGIISVLLTVKGQAQPDAVRRHLQEVVKRRDKAGNLTFPRLRHCLVTRCGTYGWQRGKFNLDQNLTVAPANYKGRAVTVNNIQDYVCEIVSKYLPQGIPPWQIIIISSSEHQHYILLKLHHVLLSEGLNIGDLLPLIPPTRQTTGTLSSKSPLVNVIEKPVAIPRLKEQISEELVNRWNEFIANFDPLECPELLKNSPGFFEFQAIILITLISIIKQCRKGFRVIKSDFLSKLKYIYVTYRNETEKRQVTLITLITSIFITLNPINMISLFIKNFYNLLIFLTIELPKLGILEIRSIYSCLTLTYCPYSNTITGTLFNYVPLIYNSIRECLYCFSIIFYAPQTILNEILLKKESFQTITLCGRKSISWSNSIKTEQIKQLSKHYNLYNLEIILTSISLCLSKYFQQTNHLIPNYIPLTLRNINSNYIFATGTNIRPEDSVSGILCLNLTIMDPEKDTTIYDLLIDLKNQFRTSLNQQGLSHLLSLFQTKFGILTKFLPSSILSIYLKYLSRKYAITITEVTCRYPNVKQRTLWGQEVVDVIYWRPPQANTSISLCINEYADQIKLAVMCDSQLVPHHSTLVRGFPEHIQDLGKAFEILSPPPPPPSTTSQPQQRQIQE